MAGNFAGALGKSVDDLADASKGAGKGAGDAVEGAAPTRVGVDAPSSTQVARELGRAGEEAAQIAKNTKHIDSLSGKTAYRIPGELTDQFLKEVKNVAKLDFDAQIRDSLHYAMMTDREFILVVRPDTALSKPLRNAIDAGWITLEFLP